MTELFIVPQSTRIVSQGTSEGYTRPHTKVKDLTGALEVSRNVNVCKKLIQ